MKFSQHHATTADHPGALFIITKQYSEGMQVPSRVDLLLEAAKVHITYYKKRVTHFSDYPFRKYKRDNEL